MHALLTGAWSVVAVSILAGPVFAQPAEPKFDKLTLANVGAVKPAPADANDTPTRKLQKEAYNARLAQLQAIVQQHQKGVTGRAEIGVAVRRLAFAEADLFDHPAAGVRWLELWDDVLADQERLTRQLLARGTGSEDDYLTVQLARINVRLEILRLKEARAGDKANPAEKLKLYELRVKVLLAREERMAQLYNKGALSGAEFYDAKAARIDAELELVKLKATLKVD